MRRILLVLVLTTYATAHAEVFRHVGPDGEIYFSDQPSPGAERVELRPAQAVTLPTVTRPATIEAAAEAEPAFSYAQFEIIKPSFDQGVRANDGSVTVYMSLQPALRPGHRIELMVNGEDGNQLFSGEALNVNLSNLSRGRHTVEAHVKNSRDETLIKTGPVGFYVLRVAGGPRPSPRGR